VLRRFRCLEIGDDVAVLNIGEESQDLRIDRVGQSVNAAVAENELANAGVPAAKILNVRWVVRIVVIRPEGGCGDPVKIRRNRSGKDACDRCFSSFVEVLTCNGISGLTAGYTSESIV
jgi:hypothetical protein